MKSYRDLLICGMLFLCVGASANGLLAFPGASGWGRFAIGGRNGSVYHVTNLNDSGTGSLRDAVSQPNRIVVFDVAGVIKISSRLTFAKNLYVAGQTAPGEGVTVYGNGVSFSNANNIICRYMKFRMGHNGDSGKDAAGIASGTNMIFDHCSFSWGRDETFSINSDGKGDLGNITIMNSIIGQGLMTHSAGGLMQADSITLYRNLYCDNSTRNNKVKGINQYVNNVVYNWSNGAYIMGGDSEGFSYVNIEGSLFINGPSKGGEAFTGANSQFHVYGNDNWQDKDANGEFSPYLITNYSASTRESEPYPYPELDKWPGNELITRLLPMVGASLPYRDPSDYYMIDEVMSFGKKGALISNEETLSSGSPSSWPLWNGEARIDTDGDGMPDWWETANGTNPLVDDAMVIASNGYANIENYINSITLETVNEHQFYLRRPWAVNLVSATSSSLTFGWSDYTRGEDGFIVEVKNGENWTEVARLGEGVTQAVISEGLQPGTAYSVRICAFKGEVKGEYCDEVVMKTKPEPINMVDCDSYSPDYAWGTKVLAKWDKSTAAWGGDNNQTYTDGSKVLFAPQKNVSILMLDTVKPSVVVVNSDYAVKFGYSATSNNSGSIAGTTSLNKSGNGELIINTTNTYTGPTVVHGGKLTAITIKNGGEPSSIGASQEFAQNLILDGGTLNYAGVNTSTNRNIQLLEESALSVEKKAVTLGMSGSVEGDANLVIDGSGTVSVKSNNFFKYTGNTILKGGTLYLSTAEISNTGIGSSKKVVMCGGELKTKGETEGYETYSFPIEVVEGKTSQLSVNRNCSIKCKITGYGDLQMNIPYLREFIKGDWSDFHGRLIANSTYSGGGLLLLYDSSSDFPNNVVELKNNAIICGWLTSMTMEVGGLAGDAASRVYGSSKNTKGFVANYIIGGANTDETYNGIITNYSCSGSGYTGTVNIDKVGTGLWRLTGANFYNGVTNVKGGRLVVNGKHTGMGVVNVSADAELAGKGTIPGAVTIENGGTLLAGDTLVDNSMLTLSGNCSMKAGSALLLNLKADGTTNYVKVGGTLNIDGAVLDVNLEDVGEIQNGTEFKVFDAAVVSGNGFAAVSPEFPNASQAWDKSRLMSDGVLRIISREEYAAGISTIGVDEVTSASYTLDGKRSDKSYKGIRVQNGKKHIVR